jgi:hypothetical protein
MEHVDKYLSGIRDYYWIKGSTGPLVYPGLHLYIYRGLHYVTNGGTDILRAQVIFASLYLFTLATVMACYRRARVRLLLASSRADTVQSTMADQSTGSCVCVSSADIKQALAQHLHAPPVQ